MQNIYIRDAVIIPGTNLLKVAGLEPLPVNLDKITRDDIKRIAEWAGEHAQEAPTYGFSGASFHSD
ncbi:hypothetical protein [Pseudomonas orientalis]|uniref:hypothetical protein n=1 Tax=Pseudomonas orientalis TaxID=76758 RepID=UPI0012FFF6D6|nr:hypothetical protein [Pseudomonas orientalis]